MTDFPGASLVARPRLLDLFCGAGGAAMGYFRAGFDVVGVDIKPQPRYPFTFVQGDALEYLAEHGAEFDAIHASPPCQAYSMMRRGRWQDRSHAELIEPTRLALEHLGKPFVIENVVGAPLRRVIELCGTMFGLATEQGSQLRRHRQFEVGFDFAALVPPCRHNNGSAIGVYGGGQHPQRRTTTGDEAGQFGAVARKTAMGIDWMSGDELSQAIPPAYTHFIGTQLFEAV
jgi:DNA (cytosine-5)-methyltransferase 1